MRVNYLGSVWCLRAFLPGLVPRRPGRRQHRLGRGRRGRRRRLYAASKHAQLAFSRAPAAELRRSGIRVHTVKPGFVETEGFSQSWLPGPCNAWCSARGGRCPRSPLARTRAGRTSVPWYYGPIAQLQDSYRIYSRASLVVADSSLDSRMVEKGTADDR